MIKHRFLPAALATLAFAGAALATAAPAFANRPNRLSVSVKLGNGDGKPCSLGADDVADGTIVTWTITHDDGTESSTKAVCRDGSWVEALILPPPGNVSVGPVRTTAAFRG